MFTGIVEAKAEVIESTRGRGSLQLTVRRQRGTQPKDRQHDVALGESIAVSGVCLTVVDCRASQESDDLRFDVVEESLAKTTLGALRRGGWVNLERSLRVGDLMGGHYVTGHVDGVGRISERRQEATQVLFKIAAAPALIDQMLPKGSIAVDGISLTLVEVDRKNNWFSFAAIPHTLHVTTLGKRRPGEEVNLETDAFGKWALHGLRSLTGDDSRDERLRRLLGVVGRRQVDIGPDAENT